MSTGSDQAGTNPRLSAEERALADRLAQVAPQGEPSGALDARILAAARASIDGHTVAARKRSRPRWPAIIAVAATLVLAAGIGWQLRPVDDLQVQYSEAPRASVPVAPVAVVAPPVDEKQGPAEPAKPATAPAPKPEPMQADKAEAESAAAADDMAGHTQRRPGPPPPPPEPPIVFDQPAPMDTPAPAPASSAPKPSAFSPPPAPAAPPAPAEARPTPQAASALGAGTVVAPPPPHSAPQRERKQAEGEAAAPVQAAKPAAAVMQDRADSVDAAAEADTRALDRIEVTGSRIDRFGDQPLDDQPPASADSPQVRQAWLQRVRQLIVQGKLDDARDSLREYQRRYPQAPLPDDLRALLVE